MPLLEVAHLTVHLHTTEGTLSAVDGVSFALDEGASLAIVGESGSGKTMSMLALMGLIPQSTGNVTCETLSFQGASLQHMPPRRLRALRGQEIGMVFQNPLSSLNPVLSVGQQMTEAALYHLRLKKSAATDKAVSLLEEVGIPQASNRLSDFPHQFSGGQRQRIGIAMALMCDPSLLIADEPTTALDVTVEAEILAMTTRLQQQRKMAVIWITHDLAVAANLVDRIAVMYAGSIVEIAPATELFEQPAHPYTRGLLRAVPEPSHREARRLLPIEGYPPALKDRLNGCQFTPRCPFATELCAQSVPPLIETTPAHSVACWHREQITNDQTAPPPRATAASNRAYEETDEVLIAAHDLAKYFNPSTSGFGKTRHPIKAVDGVHLEIRRGETLGLVGESGSGKSTVGRLMLRLLNPTRGEVFWKGERLSHLNRQALRQTRRDIQMIFQDPMASLNPRMTVGASIGEPLRIHDFGDRQAIASRVEELLQQVGLEADHKRRYPHEFSGGQRQRIGIARALATHPTFIVADEPVAALDVSIQAQIINLLEDLKAELGLTFLFIAHDLAVVRHISDRVAVMYLGRIVEQGATQAVYETPRHPYTKALLASRPTITSARVPTLSGLKNTNTPDPANPPSGCRFHPRCPIATGLCSNEDPELRDLRESPAPHLVACHHTG